MPQHKTFWHRPSFSAIVKSSCNVLRRCAWPAIYQFPEVAQDGGCVAYGPRLVKIFGELVTWQLVKLLRGTKPADLPVSNRPSSIW